MSWKLNGIYSMYGSISIRTPKTKANAPVGVLFGFVFAGQLDCRYSRKFLSYRIKRFTRFYAYFGRTSLTTIIELKSKWHWTAGKLWQSEFDFCALTRPSVHQVHTGKFSNQHKHTLIISGGVGCNNFKSKSCNVKSRSTIFSFFL